MSTFHSRASGKRTHRRFGLSFKYPRGFARLQWQLFNTRIDTAKTNWAMDRIAACATWLAVKRGDYRPYMETRQ